ncbi:histone-lysine N-methyltransferase ASHH1-like isoform X2 [Impatiens glandulifera]|uniref:histone-lysine N-methyltransferase ASHH1-like isoform X2 n=1 Tax=Impatiens glandulifera TaxID=253017 RepID=UPI001FB13C33|nr:histone-lysine N-methyltransferase ASHH1-like isoform X2 [Impatiens glandulifera]
MLPPGVPSFTHITRNDFGGRKNKKLKTVDIAVCVCKWDASLPNSACVKSCLNVMSSIECTPGYCPCGDMCQNQKFQKLLYAKTKLFQTADRGWGMLADENIKAGQFIIEYCGEVISSVEAKSRSLSYEAEGVKGAYIFSLNTNFHIDATKKGSLGRFINHSCEPNCETRKLNVLGEIRVGIFAKKNITIGTELVYDYKFEWYGGENVRCLCGASTCSKFLGAKSAAFLENNHVWVEGDLRYKVEEVPLYDSAEDEKPDHPGNIKNDLSVPAAISNITTDSASKAAAASSCVEFELAANGYTFNAQGSAPKKRSQQNGKSTSKGSSAKRNAKPFASKIAQEEVLKFEENSLEEGNHRYKVEEIPLYESAEDDKPDHMGNMKIDMIAYTLNAQGSVSKRRAQQKGKKSTSEGSSAEQVDGKRIAKLFASKEAQNEILKCEGERSEADSKLNSVYDEIRPAIEEHNQDNQDKVDDSMAKKWIEAHCAKMKADFNFHFSVVKNSLFAPPNGTSKPANDPSNS